MKNNSMKYNILLNSIRILSSIIFPLITFPYSSRILQVENLGKVNFTSSIVSYFLLLATLGIPTYAIREGSRLKNDRDKFNKFTDQIFTLSLLSLTLSYVILFLIIPIFDGYRNLILLQSLTMIGTTIGVEWIYSIHEQYEYITIRSIIFQLISLILLIIFVKNPEDYYIYAGISVLSNVGSSVLNYVNIRKQVKFKLTTKLNLKKHIYPILIIFSTSIATTFYVNSDMTMIGILAGDYSVGIYSVSVRIYTIVKSLVSSIYIVTLPRLSYYISENDEERTLHLMQKILNLALTVTLPILTGLILLSEEIIEVISGSNYLEANTSLIILSIALLFSVLASFFANAILLPRRGERFLLIASVISAVGNILLNLLLIPRFKQDGAAFTTLIAEITIFLILLYYSFTYVRILKFSKKIISSTVGCILIIILNNFLSSYILTPFEHISYLVVSSIVGYYFVLLAFIDEEAKEIKVAVERVIFKLLKRSGKNRSS